MSKQEEESKHEQNQAGVDFENKVFLNLQEDTPTEPIESLCVNCEKNGLTKFLFSKIPFFKEIILAAFECEHCGFRNSEVQFGGKIAEFGQKYSLNVVSDIHMSRNVVKSEFATIKIPALDLEIPPQTQKGSIKTVEGFLMSTIEGISDLQAERRKYDPATAAQIDAYLEKLEEYRQGKHYPFQVELEDPSGNSFIQNPNAPSKDNYMTVEHFRRSIEDLELMGYSSEQAVAETGVGHARQKVELKEATTTSQEQQELIKKAAAYAVRDPEITAQYMDFTKPIDSQDAMQEGDEDDVKKSVMRFQTECYSCASRGFTQMCISSIPFFKEIIIMAFSCDACGYKNTEIKTGGGIGPEARRITFHFEKEEDLNRDCFKSDTTKLEIPEIELALEPGTLGSMYSTVEGLLMKIHDQLEQDNPFKTGDSSESQKFKELLQKIAELREGKKKFTLIMDDGLANQFMYNPFAPEADPQMLVENYPRTEEQNDDLGISQMNV